MLQHYCAIFREFLQLSVSKISLVNKNVKMIASMETGKSENIYTLNKWNG